MEELHFEEVFLCGIEGIAAVVELKGSAFTRLDGGLVGRKELLREGRNRMSVFIERPAHLIVGERLEVVFVENLDTAHTCVNGFDTDVLIDFLHLEILRFGREVGAHHTVHTEHAVVGFVAKVTAISPIARAVGGVVEHGLVDPVPNGTAHDVVVAFDDSPIVDQVADGVTHRVGVFGDVEGIFNTLIRTLSDILGQTDGGILVGAHIDDVVVALILHGAAGVESLDGVVGLDKVFAGSGFVAQTPDADRGVVDGGVDHLHIARHVLIAKFGNVAQ